MRARLRTERGERGAALVEMAIVTPLLLLLLLGIIEFGWLFGQYNAVRHGAREAARYAAVDAGNTGSTSNILGVACSAIEGQGAGISALRVAADNGGGVRGGQGEVIVEADVVGLTNAPLISSFLPSTLRSSVAFIQESDANWSSQGLTVTSC